MEPFAAKMPASHLEQLDDLPRWYWWFKNRIEFSADLIGKKSQVVRRWVDFGSGPGAMTRELAKKLHALGVISPEAEIIGAEADASLHGKLKENGIQPLIINLDEIGPDFPDKFDLFTAFDLLEHLEKPELLLQAIYRQALPGAIGVITVPAMKILWSDWDVVMHHHRRYELQSLNELLEKTGFKILECRAVFHWAFIPALVRKYKQNSFEFPQVGRIMNRLLFELSRLEWRYNPFPFKFGTSLIALVIK